MSETNYTSHYSVLLEESLEAMRRGAKDCPSPIFADMTFGGGGHTFAFANQIENSTVYSTDQDPDALENGYKRIEKENMQGRIFLNAMNFEKFPTWVKENHPDLKFNGILMDLGVSSHHFDKFERGFSFREDAPLDMRMNHEDDTVETAADFLNDYDEESIANVIFKYGEERLSRRIAAEIIARRSEKRITRTKELEDICFHAYPKKMRHGRIHPATKTFQALRIYVNRELEVLENTLEDLFSILAPGGILGVISFHSLEDRIAKHKFKEIFQTDKNIAKIITKKPIYPSEKELAENSRSRSAKLRLLQRI